jgi:predicted NBD/HSP70 family sugar kinase
MEMNRSNITLLVNELLAEKLVREGDQGSNGVRGRKPTFLYINSEKGYAIGLDVRATRTFMMITDSIGKQIGEIVSFPTNFDPHQFVRSLGVQVRKALERVGSSLAASSCDGIGIVFPGMVDRESGIVINAPKLGWKQVHLIQMLEEEFDGIPIRLENSGRACALSQIWSTRREGHSENDRVFVSVSDGVGVGVVVNGELMRGRHNIAGEFAHVPLSIDGPQCSCGAHGCWEAYISNMATLSRYFGRNISRNTPPAAENFEFTIEDLIARARSGDARALTALNSTARYLGLGLATLINAIDPSFIDIGGEITEAWDLIELQVREAIEERTLTKGLGRTVIRIVPAAEHPRLRGAVALVTSTAFAAPKVA